MVILIWVDDAYGLISWKMDLELGHDVDTTFGNPDFVAYAESFGADGYRIAGGRRAPPHPAGGAGRRHRLGHRLSGRLLGQPRAHPLPRRARRIAVLSRGSTREEAIGVLLVLEQNPDVGERVVVVRLHQVHQLTTELDSVPLQLHRQEGGHV